MAEAVSTLAELVTINDRNLADLELENFFSATPFVENNAATTASYDTKHRWLRHVLPDVDFRAVNDGREVQKSVDTALEIDLKHIDGSFRVDRALVSEYHKGGKEGWLNRELARHLKAMMITLEKQVFQGTGFKTGGFDGFPDLTELSSIGSFVHSAGGTTADVQTSAYLVRGAADGVEIVTGYSGDIYVGEPTIQETAGAVTGTFPAIYTPVGGWYGLKAGTYSGSGAVAPSVVRIANIENAFDDDDIYKALELFDTAAPPTALYLSPKAAELLRSSRTATTTTGAPPPLVESVAGMQVYVTNGISKTEALVP